MIRVSDVIIQANDIFNLTKNYGHGAQSYFFGSVREINHGKKVLAVSYDAFAPLAENIIKEICDEAQAQWGPRLIMVVFHRIGKLNVGDISVGIGVGSPHRNESFLASRFIIEQIKLRAPIWKKEHYENGETEWLKGHALCQHD